MNSHAPGPSQPQPPAYGPANPAGGNFAPNLPPNAPFPKAPWPPAGPVPGYPGPAITQPPVAPRDKVRLGELFMLSGQVFSRGLVTILGLGLPSILSLFIYFVAGPMSELHFNPVFDFIRFLLFTAGITLPLCLHCSVAIYVHGSLKNSPPSFAAALTGGLERIVQIIFFYVTFFLAASLIGAIVMGLVYLSDLTVPGLAVAVSVLFGTGFILLFSRICVLFAISAVEKIPTIKAMTRAWRLSRGNLISVIMATLTSLTVLSSLVLLIREIVRATGDNLVVFLFLIILSVFLVCYVSTLLSVLYCQLKISDESFNITLESIVFDQVQIPVKP
jgi:hypothetical protein